MKQFVIGDIHGSYRALKQVLERSGFDYETDKLICLGDICDGWSETPQCIEELSKVKNLIYCLGNHDLWLDAWLNWGQAPINWTEQGGRATINAYLREAKQTHGIPLMVRHRDFFRGRRNYYLDKKKNNLFVHGGTGLFNDEAIEKTSREDLLWDRLLFEKALTLNEGDNRFNEVFIGHTTTERFSFVPVKKGNVWMCDQGCGWGGCLSIMDTNTHEFWTSDKSKDLYPEERGR